MRKVDHGIRRLVNAVPVSEVLTLARRFEPVLRYTEGELFLPMPVDRYVESAALYRRLPGRRRRLVAPATKINLSTLVSYAGHGGGTTSSSTSSTNLESGGLPPLAASPRSSTVPGRKPFAMVGLFGRLIDSIMRFSLIVRGKVPGGFAAAAHVRYQEAGTLAPTYYVRAVRDAGYLVLQYWFFYAMNDWRSTFSGVNDHEADWEQITLFLTEPDDGGDRSWPGLLSLPTTRWEMTCRRVDDPDLQLVDGTHPWFTRCRIAQRRLPARGLHRFGISAGGGEAHAAVAALCTHDHANEHPAAPGDRSPVHRLSAWGRPVRRTRHRASVDGCRDRR